MRIRVASTVIMTSFCLLCVPAASETVPWFCIAKDAWSCPGPEWIERVERLDRSGASREAADLAGFGKAGCSSYPWLLPEGQSLVNNKITVMEVGRKYAYFCQKIAIKTRATEQPPTFLGAASH